MKFLRFSVNRVIAKRLSHQAQIHSSCSHAEWYKPNGTDTGIMVYNCVTKNKVPLVIKNNLATWYSCGPTVYDSAHIGHGSCYVRLDIVQRIIINYFNINLITSMGVTDIDDKIIKRSCESQIPIQDITIKYELEFWKNLSDLGVTLPNVVTRVTEHIPTIKKFISEIMNKELCYVAPDNSVYFDTTVFKNYGKLQHAQHTEDDNDVNKKSKTDFALWKTQKPGEPFWDSDWGKGRPGWHIECSAMASRLFGKTVDFHAGGIDLQFPHHENEEAQSCAYHGHKQWVNYWLHAGHLHVKGDVKMSKSLKNTISINDLLKSHNAATFRMACLLSHYRHPMEYCEDMMKKGKATNSKLKYFTEICADYMNDNNSFADIDENLLMTELENTKKMVDKLLRDDFDTANCITHIMSLVTTTTSMLKTNNKDIPKDFKPIPVGLVLNYIQYIMNCFGIVLDKHQIENVNALPDIINTLVKFRHSVRVLALESKEKSMLKECDTVRDILKNYNIKINDQPGGKSSSWIYTE